MATARIAPHLTAPQAVAFTGWMVAAGNSLVPVSELPPWDYALALELHSQASIDRQMALANCELDREARLAVAVTAECTDTFWQSTDLVPLEEAANLEVRVPPGTVAKRLTLTRRVVVLDKGSVAGPLTPLRGNIIAGQEDRTVVPLEGSGGQFPSEALSFRETGRPDAPWQLNLTYEDPNDSFLGSVQLLLNIDDPRTRHLVDGDAPDEAEELLRVLPWDLGRQLITRAIHDDRLTTGTDWMEGSVGEALERLCLTVGFGSVGEARRRWEIDPDGFDAEVKAGLGGLR